MSLIFKNLLFIFIFWGIFIYVILKIPYPQTLFSATPFQTLAFFIPLFLGLTFVFNIFLRNFFISLSVSLGLIILLVLKGLDILNFITGTITVVTVGLLISYFRKTKKHNLTKLPKIPKLTQLRKQKP